MRALADELLDLVAMPSVTGQERDLADRLEERLRQGPAGRGHQVLRFGDSLVLTPDGSGAAGRPLCVLAGHIDTVPRGDAPEPSFDGVRVIGRGACDMKAGIAVMLALSEDLRPAAGFSDRVFVFYAGEEGPAAGNGLAEVFERRPELTRADLAILLEPTDGFLELGCNGSMHLTVTFAGKACHSARPWQGMHPLLPALPWLDRILRVPPREAEIAGVIFREVATITRLRAGEARNVVPAALELNLNLRYPPDRSQEEAEGLARSLLPEGTICLGFSSQDGGITEVDRAIPAMGSSAAVPMDQPGSVTARLVDHSPPGKIDLAAPLYRYLLEATGLPRRAKQGWTDVARFTACGVPALNWGPGNPELAHTSRESVEVAAVQRCLDQMKGFLLGAGPVKEPR